MGNTGVKLDRRDSRDSYIFLSYFIYRCFGSGFVLFVECFMFYFLVLFLFFVGEINKFFWV